MRDRTRYLSTAPVLRKVDELERQRSEIEQRVVGWEKEDESAHALANVTDAQVRTMLGRMADEMRLYERGALKDFLMSILDRIELDRSNKPCNSVTASHSVVGIAWRPHGDSNPGTHRERVMS